MTASLTSRERVLRAVHRRADIDRVPSLFRAEEPLMRRLREQLNLPDNLAVFRHFHADSIQVAPAFKPGAKQPPDKDGYFTDLLGNRYRSIRNGDMESYAVVEPVLADATSPDDIHRVKWPGPDVLDLGACVHAAREAHDTGLAVYGGIWATLFTGARNLMGEEPFLLAMVENPNLITAIVERLTQSYLDMNAAYLHATRGLIDVYYFGSDLGTQRSMFISPDMTRQFIIPGIAKLTVQAKSLGLPVMYHTCGAVNDIIPDLIRAGVDVLDPVQVSATGMSPDQLAAQFKGKIAFHGAISTQTTLPNGSPDDIKAAVHHTLQTLGPAGIIAGPDQEMIGDIPLASLEAMSEAIRAFPVQS
jgi:uroporphyrinogen decarboxylase